MKILIATGLYAPEIGGPATYTHMLEEDLPRFGFKIVVVPFSKVRHLPPLIRHVFYMWFVFREAVRSDMILALDPVSVGAPAWVVSLITGKPFTVRVAGDFAWEQSQIKFGIRDSLEIFYKKRYSYPLLIKIYSFVEGFITSRAKLVIIPSKYLAKIVLQWGVVEDRIVTIYSAHDPIPVSASKEILRQKFGYSGIVITSAGRLVPNKGFVKLIEVFAKLLKKRDGMHLIIMGDGPDELILKSLIHKYELDTSVTLTGRLERTELGERIAASDIFVLNTEHEGFSHQLLEVMGLGVPIVSTAVGGNTELIENGKSGLLVPFNDEISLQNSIETLLTHPEKVSLFVSEAKKRTALFNENNLLRELVTQLKKFE